MFRKISSALTGKYKKLKDQEEKTAGLKAVFRSVMERTFGRGAAGLPLEASYNTSEEEITVQTPNKAVASEMSLRLEEIAGELRKNGIVFRRIIIR